MSSLFKPFKITATNLFVIIFIFFSTLEAKSSVKPFKADNISNYFSGILLLKDNQYSDSYNYLKKLDGLEEIHLNYSSVYLYSLVNSGNFNRAFEFSKKLEKNNKDSFESNLIMGIYYLKNSKNNLANKYFLRANSEKSISLLESFTLNSLSIWSDVNSKSLTESVTALNQIDDRLRNFKRIQKVFLNCYFDTNNTENLFDELVSDQRTDFSRYSFFYANYLYNTNKEDKAIKVINDSLDENPRNVLLNQYKLDLKSQNKNFIFDCKNEQHVIAEILYISANVISSQFIYPLSNFYLNLSKFLNKDFLTYDSLIAENFYNIQDFKNAKKIYKRLLKNGEAFKWHSNKQISKILIQEGDEKGSLKLLEKSYDELSVKGVYETFDYAEFLKNNDEFKNSVKYYSIILNLINKEHPLYHKVTDGRGVAYERIGDWDNAEEDLLESLKAKPDQAYVINYLAYSWIEKGVKINESLEMLKKANKLKSNDPYIIDSLGWALFKLKRYEEAKKYLQLALKLMPADPIVNDHFGDALWKNGKEIQARYYWNYVLSLENTDNDLKKLIKKKLIKGL